MASASFLPVYLAVGADKLKRQVVLERLQKRVAEMGDLDFNRDVFLGSGADPDELIAACNTLPFMSEYRLVIIKDAHALSKGARDALTEYLASPNETAILALDAEKIAKNTRLYKAVAAIDSKAIINCEPKKRRDLPAQVQDFALSEGISITPSAANELIDMVGESTVHLDTELKKMSAALGRGSTVDVQHVRQLVTRVSEVKPWTFVDAVSSRDTKKVALLLHRMEDQSPYGLLTQVLNRVRELLIAKELRSQGVGALMSELGKRDFQVKNHFRWADSFSSSELERALVSGADLEQAMKSGSDPQQYFERWVLELCTGPLAGQ